MIARSAHMIATSLAQNFSVTSCDVNLSSSSSSSSSSSGVDDGELERSSPFLTLVAPPLRSVFTSSPFAHSIHLSLPSLFPDLYWSRATSLLPSS